MRAVRYYGRGDVRVDEVEEPTVGPRQVKIAPAFVGICGSDLHEYVGGPIGCPTSPHPLTGLTVPITLGHEFSGIITEIGSEVPPGFEVGQACTAMAVVSCDECPACREEAWNLCSQHVFLGTAAHGGLSDAVCVDSKFVLPLPENMSLEKGALVEPLAVAWHGVDVAGSFGPDSTVLIIGGGPVGLAVVQCLKAKGVKNIIVSEVAAARQHFSLKFGAAKAISPVKDDVIKSVMEFTNGHGVDLAVDCAGVPASITTACLAIKIRGTVLNLAMWEKDVAFNPNLLMIKDGTYKASIAYTKADYQAVIDSISNGSLNAEIMITRKIKLENIVEDGLKALLYNKDNEVKILIDIHDK